MGESQSPHATIELAGFLFEVAITTTDANGNSVAIPGKCLGRAPKSLEPKSPEPNKRSGQAAVALTPSMAHAPATAPARRPSSAVSPAPARPRKARSQSTARRTPAQRWQPRYQKPPPLIVKTEPMSAGAVWGWVVAIALVVAGIWLMNVGNEEAKWRSVEATAKAIRGR